MAGLNQTMEGPKALPPGTCLRQPLSEASWAWPSLRHQYSSLTLGVWIPMFLDVYVLPLD